MTRSLAPSLLPTAMLVLMLGLAPAVLAKEPGIAAQLQTTIPPDAEPGITIDVAFTLTALGDPAQAAYDADPLSIRVIDRHGAYVDVLAVRDAPGHYVGTITVPQAGIDGIYATLPGEGPAPAVWQLYAAPPVVQAAADPVTPGAGTAPVSEWPAWLIAIGVVVALIAAAGALIAGRRRTEGGRTVPTRA